MDADHFFTTAKHQVRFIVVTMLMILFLFLLLLSQGMGSDACWKEERVALLKLKDSFTYPNSLSQRMLSWRKDVDCCKWDGVGCNTTTGRIYELMLYSFREEGFVDWYFDASLFLPFQELQRLVLQNNNIICCAKNEGFERLSSIINLEHLDLSFNKMGNTILPFLGGVTSLKSLYISEIALIGTSGLEELSKLRNLEVLDLSFNDLYSSILPLLRGLHSLRTLFMSDTQQKGSINTQDLIALSNLEELDISSNNIGKFDEPKDIEGSSNITVLWLNNGVSNGSIFQLHSLKALPKLKSLHLEWNNFTEVQISKGLSNFNDLKELYLDYSDMGNNNAFLLSIANMTSLQILSLPGCELAGSIQGIRGLCNLKNLLELDLSWNNLNGGLPHCLANLTFLQHLDLSHNHLTGKISQSPLKILTSIKFLALSNNQFEIPSSLSLFLNHSKLKTFEAFGNEVYLEKGVVNHNLEPKFQLERFYLESSLRGGSFPEFLYHQSDLQVIYISGITMTGLELPSWLLENNTNLKSLILSDCSISGFFSLPIRNPNATLTYLDISRNHIYGQIPTEIGAYFPNLVSLILSENMFIGSIPKSLSNCSFLTKLVVRQNQLFGEFPWWVQYVYPLKVLDLSKNMLFGSLSSRFETPMLKHLLLSENRLEGPLPHSASDLNNLVSLDLSHNCLKGIIPKWIGELHELRYLLLNHNNFIGDIPIDLRLMNNQLRLVDLSQNELSASFVNYSHNYKDEKRYPDYYYLEEGVFEFVVKGNILGYKIDYIFSMGFTGLDLSCNNLTGSIPSEIGNIQHIKLLNLSHNSLTGPIPSLLSNMTEIETLDLSYNNLSGTIPLELAKLKFLEVFNVSYNNLSGKTPDRIAQFATFDESSYQGNPFLCGSPLPKSCSQEATIKENSDDKEVDGGFIDMSVFYVSFFVSFIVIIVVGIASILGKKPNWGKPCFYFSEVVVDSCYRFCVWIIFLFC